MTFRDFMARSLSDPHGGYYTRNARIGFSRGDFYTAPELSPAFALLLSRQIVESDVVLDHPKEFYLMETGPGNGTLMRDILASLRLSAPDLWRRTRPLLYEISPVLADRQKEKLSSIHLPCEPEWIRPGELSGRTSFTGMIYGNEFLDALPVHRIRKTRQGFSEIYVEQDESGAIAEVEGALSSPSLTEGVHTTARDYPEGFEWEAQADLCNVLSELSGVLHRGFMLWIDYGDTALERLSPKREKGSLVGYRKHSLVEDVTKAEPGSIDMTVHVDFPLVARQSKALGMQLEGFSDQMHFLMALGIGEWLSDEQFSPEERSAMATLIHPLRMGEAFKVMLLSRGIDRRASWKGFPREPLPL
ncbi:MAG: SAM-dependent methyltransferase [Nitrospirae bacterium]|jgi:SAM-dependent MidA family methyltransferase|nr:SAM-dependent methyltransferase [Nitrospirota bacterium]